MIKKLSDELEKNFSEPITYTSMDKLVAAQSQVLTALALAELAEAAREITNLLRHCIGSEYGSINVTVK